MVTLSEFASQFAVSSEKVETATRNFTYQTACGTQDHPFLFPHQCWIAFPLQVILPKEPAFRQG